MDVTNGDKLSVDSVDSTTSETSTSNRSGASAAKQTARKRTANHAGLVASNASQQPIVYENNDSLMSNSKSESSDVDCEETRRNQQPSRQLKQTARKMTTIKVESAINRMSARNSHTSGGITKQTARKMGTAFRGVYDALKFTPLVIKGIYPFTILV